jgi:excisionase family DNA binding protein
MAVSHVRLSAGEPAAHTGPVSALYSVRQVADRFGVHPETVRRLIHEGRLDALRIGRVLRVDGEAVEAFVAQQRVKPARG